MAKSKKGGAANEWLQGLAEFRHQLRLFLHFSESEAERHEIQPQQHQLLLQIAGVPAGVAPTVGYAAERLGLRHNTVVELSNRCQEIGLLKREHSDKDRRYIILRLTAKGERMLESLSVAHARELNVLAPRLIRTLARITTASPGLRRTTVKGYGI